MRNVDATPFAELLEFKAFFDFLFVLGAAITDALTFGAFQFYEGFLRHTRKIRWSRWLQ